MKTFTPPTTTTVDWQNVATSLDTVGYAVTTPILSLPDCTELIALYDDPVPWRSRTAPDRYRLGPGEYQHFAYPLPHTVAALREECYTHLSPIARSWHEKLDVPGAFPDTLDDFLNQCHKARQPNPTPLITKHQAHDYLGLHQDDDESRTFPLQVMVMLSKASKDYTGGEFLLVENSPRAQSRGRAVVLKQGQAVIYPTSWRPGTGNRGHYKINVRNGVSTVHTGARHTLKLSFHDTN
jgi:hypothetical protein